MSNRHGCWLHRSAVHIESAHAGNVATVISKTMPPHRRRNIAKPQCLLHLSVVMQAACQRKSEVHIAATPR